MENSDLANEDLHPTLQNDGKRWRECVGGNLVSDKGDVWSKRTKAMRKIDFYDGYRRVRVLNKSVGVSRLIYETFVGPIEEGNQVDHINRNSMDDTLENLRQVTPKENSSNKDLPDRGYIMRLELRPYVKRGLPQIQYCQNAAIFKSVTDAVNNTPGATRRGICGACCNTKNKRKTHCGYEWMREEKHRIVYDHSDEKYLPIGMLDGLDLTHLEISESGKIRHIDDHYPLRIDNKKYPGITLCSKPNSTISTKDRSYIGVHRLVAIVHLSHLRLPGKDFVDHIEPDTKNYHKDNLRWVSRLENNNKASAIAVRSIDSEGNTKEYISVAEASRQTGAHAGHIHQCCKGHYGRKTSGGYRWEYVDKVEIKPIKSWGEPVIGTDKDGNELEFTSATEAARYLNTSPSHIHKCCRNKQQYVKGYTFVYKY